VHGNPKRPRGQVHGILYSVKRWQIAACLATIGVAALAFLGSRRPPEPEAAPIAVVTAIRQVGTRAAPHVAGRVVVDGQPVAGATVRLWPGVALATTGADGRFDLGEPSYGARKVVAAAPGRRAVSAPLPPGPARENLELSLLPCGAALSGTVRDAAGGGIARPFLSATAEEMRVIGETTGDDTGAFSLCVAPGTSYVEVQAAGYATQGEAVEATGAARHDFVLSPEAVVEGRIVDDDQEPIPSAIASGVGAGRGMAIADESGAFRLVGLAPGRIYVSCGAQGYTRGSVSSQVMATVERTAHVECQLHRGRTIAGRLVTADGPAGELSVLASGPGGNGSATCDADGSFSMDGLPEGELTLSAGYREVLSQEPATLPKTGDVSGVVLRVGPTTTVTGRVTRNGRPIAGASIAFSTYRPVMKIVTDDAGAFAIRDLLPGRTRLSATSEALGAGGEVEVTLARGEARTGVAIDLALGGVISGQVVDASGAPVAGALVHFEAENRDGGEGTSDTDGHFQAGTLIGGRTYQATVYRSRTSRIRLPPAPGRPFPEVAVKDADTRVDGVQVVVSRAEGQISGTVIDETGAPVADVTVGVSRPDLKMENLWLNWHPIVRTVTTSDGRFVLRGLPVGRYTVVAKAPADEMTAVPDVATDDPAVTLAFPAKGELVGTVEGFTGPTRVMAIDAVGRSHEAEATGGQFHIDGVPRGTAVVTASTIGAGSSQLDVVRLEVTTRTEVKLQARPTYQLTGVMVDGAGAPATGECYVTLTAGTDMSFRVGADGHFAFDAPVGLEARLDCVTAQAFVSRPLSATTAAGATVELRLVADPH